MANSQIASGMVVSGMREPGILESGKVDSTSRRTGIQKGRLPTNGQANQNKTGIKPDFKTKKPWKTPRLYLSLHWSSALYISEVQQQ